jgi:ribosomal protein S17
MRKITLALLALGFVGATAISAPTTSMAQGVVLSDHGARVQIVNRTYNRRHAKYDRDYDNQPYAAKYYRGSDKRLHAGEPDRR